MKSILTYCIGLLLPILLVGQVPSQNLIDQIRSQNPYPLEGHKNPVYKHIIANYKTVLNSKFNTTTTAALAPLAIRQKLDSIITIPTDTNSLSKPHKSAYTYNMNGNITSSAEYEWNKGSATWYYLTKEEWNYNAGHYLIEYFTYYGDTVTWYNESKSEYTYDQFGRLTTLLGYGWNDSSNQWDPGIKYENTYDGSGRIITSIYFEYDAINSVWNQVKKNEYNYDATLFDLVITYYDWASQWNKSAKEEFNYDFYGKETVYTYYQWDGSGDWANYYQSKSQTNANDQFQNITEYLWDVISQIWVNSKKADYTYDPVMNNMSPAIFRKYVKQLQGYILESKEDCVYDTNYKNKDLLLPPDLKFTPNVIRFTDNDIYFNNMLKKYTYSIHDGVKYISNNTKTFFYSPKNITKTNDYRSLSKIEIVPNPASKYFSLVAADNSIKEFKLFDLNGKLQILKTIYSNETITTEFLAKGIYLYRIILNDNSVQSGKLVLN